MDNRLYSGGGMGAEDQYALYPGGNHYMPHYDAVQPYERPTSQQPQLYQQGASELVGQGEVIEKDGDGYEGDGMGMVHAREQLPSTNMETEFRVPSVRVMDGRAAVAQEFEIGKQDREGPLENEEYAKDLRIHDRAAEQPDAFMDEANQQERGQHEEEEAILSVSPSAAATEKSKGLGTVASLGLPLARVRRLMKEEGDIHMVSAESGVLITKAAELFLELMTTEVFKVMAREGRQSLQYKDAATAVQELSNLDFLRDIVPPKVRVPAEVLAKQAPPPPASPSYSPQKEEEQSTTPGEERNGENGEQAEEEEEEEEEDARVKEEEEGHGDEAMLVDGVEQEGEEMDRAGFGDIDDAKKEDDDGDESY